MEEQKDRGERSGPLDPTRKLLKVFGVKVTDYEAKSDALLARWSAADAAERAAIQGEALELSADLADVLREVTAHVLERQERVLTALR
ncbi:MAG: hypothetical protein ABI888_05965 [Chloroflexota bacterium]